MKEDISLLHFFDYSPKKFLLNFITIHVNDARLHFINKNTMPNMPIWAAILSATSLPGFYKSF